MVGAGPGGMEAARVAALRGHKVTITDIKDKIGGQLLVASVPPYKEELAQLVRYYGHQLEKLGVEICLGEEITPERILERAPNAVIVATGAVPVVPGSCAALPEQRRGEADGHHEAGGGQEQPGGREA